MCMYPKFQGKVTEAMKEGGSLQYGQLKAKDYIPGAEVLKEVPSDEDGEGQHGKILP